MKYKDLKVIGYKTNGIAMNNIKSIICISLWDNGIQNLIKRGYKEVRLNLIEIGISGLNNSEYTDLFNTLKRGNTYNLEYPIIHELNEVRSKDGIEYTVRVTQSIQNDSIYTIIGRMQGIDNRYRYIIVDYNGRAFKVTDSDIISRQIRISNVVVSGNRLSDVMHNIVDLNQYDSSIKFYKRFRNDKFMVLNQRFQAGFNNLKQLNYKPGSKSLISAWKAIARPLVKEYWDEDLRLRNNNIKKMKLLDSNKDMIDVYREHDEKTIPEFNTFQSQVLHIDEIYGQQLDLYKSDNIGKVFGEVRYRGGIVYGEIVGFVPPLYSLDQLYSNQDDLVIAPELPPEVHSMYATFRNCKHLKALGNRWPSGLKTIRHICENCTALEEVPDLPKEIKILRMGAFNNCIRLKLNR